jgi:4'-phosphopantetheinyl transferase
MEKKHWMNLNSGGILPQGEIHVWALKLNQPDASDKKYTSTLSVQELARADAFRTDKLRARYIFTHFGLRIILGLYLNREAKEIVYGYEPHGKPYILEPDADGLFFNLTYSQDLALIALVRGNSIGIDLEYCKVIPDVDQLVDRYFSSVEISQYFQSRPEDRINAFYRCWTRKEAFVKALGNGLSYPLNSFSVSLLPEEPARLIRLNSDATAPYRWQIIDLSPRKGYEAALAVEGDISRIVSRQWDNLILLKQS